jgi:hypothetical protein
MNNDLRCLEQSSFRCWEQATSSYITKSLIPLQSGNQITFYTQLAVASTGGMVGILCLVGLLSYWHQSRRKIQRQHRVERLERLWLSDVHP